MNVLLLDRSVVGGREAGDEQQRGQRAPAPVHLQSASDCLPCRCAAGAQPGLAVILAADRSREPFLAMGIAVTFPTDHTHSQSKECRDAQHQDRRHARPRVQRLPQCSSACSPPASTSCASISRTARAADHVERARLVRDARAAARPRGRDHGRPAGSEDPRRQVRRRQGRRSRRGRRSSSTPNASSATRRASVSTTRSCRSDVSPRAVLLLNDGLIRLNVESVDGPRIVTQGRAGRHAFEQQGDQPDGRRSHGAGADGEGHGRHEDGGDARSRLPRRVVSRRTRKTCTWRASCCAPRAAARC